MTFIGRMEWKDNIFYSQNDTLNYLPVNYAYSCNPIILVSQC